MKIVQINATCGKGSTGKIAVSISELLSQYNIENYVLYASGQSDYSLSVKYATDKLSLMELRIEKYENKN